MSTPRTATALSTLVMTLTVVAFPAASLAATPDEAIVDTFATTGPVDETLSGSELLQSHFDLAQYVSHPCYNIVGSERENCTALFGRYGDLRQTLQSGELADILAMHNLLGEKERLAIELVRTGALLDPNFVDEQNFKMNGYGDTNVTEVSDNADLMLDFDSQIRNAVNDRMNRIWEVCGGFSLDTAERQSCFQCNQRLAQMTDVPVDGNVY